MNNYRSVLQVPRGDMLMIMGDFNARVGNDIATWQGVIGRFGLGEQNENGVRLLDFCAMNQLVIMNTLFQHRSCHQMTWFHPAESSQAGGGHVLDYILANRQFRTSVLDTRVYCNTHLDSDHCLLVSKLRLKLRAKCRMAKQHPRPQVDSRYLNQQQVDDFRALLSEKLAIYWAEEQFGRSLAHTQGESIRCTLLPAHYSRDGIGRLGHCSLLPCGDRLHWRLLSTLS